MSSDEDRSQGTIPAKKRRVQRACDMCRRKRRACDGLRMSEKKCTYCIENGLECTFAGAIAKRRGSYVETLEARLDLTEQLLRQMSQAPVATTSASSLASSQWSSDSPIVQHRSAAAGPGPGVELAALTIRSMNTPAPSPPEEDLQHVDLAQDMSNLSINNFNERFHGKSSGALLIKTAVRLREGYEEKVMPWTSRRMHYWTYNPTKDKIPHVGPYIFPESDVLSELVDHYFAHWNIYYPLLHRPTFEKSIADGLHTRDTSFGAVVLLVCAIGSRFSDDVRVCPPEAEPLRCGWQYFDQVSPAIDQLFARPSLHQIQYCCLATAFLEFSVSGPGWTLIGIGIRMAQDVGAHRAHDGKRPTIESELWKRAFWVLICMDRQWSSALGRPCTTHYEDFDVELPIEVDDEFADPSCAFKQPAGKPSRITFFNCFIRLNNLLAFSLQMLYSLKKAKDLLAVRDDAWEEHIAVELDSALNDWVDSIPPHLRWNPNRRDDVFFDQSALLYCSYYQLQMIIHRPFISVIRKGVAAALPSLAICTNAARSCTHVADISKHRKNGIPVPVLFSSTFMSALVLLLNVWSGKHTGLPPQMNTAITEVHKAMASIQVCEKRWQTAGLSWDLLYELTIIGQFPLPPQLSTPAPITARNRNSNKRAREDDPAPPPAAGHYPSHRDTDPTSTPVPTSTPASHATPPEFIALPTSTADLGALPIFHQHAESTASTSTSTGAPLGYPDFSAGMPFADQSNSDPFAFGPGNGVDFGLGADAMWPTGFEIADEWHRLDDWGARSSHSKAPSSSHGEYVLSFKWDSDSHWDAVAQPTLNVEVLMVERPGKSLLGSEFSLDVYDSKFVVADATRLFTRVVDRPDLRGAVGDQILKAAQPFGAAWRLHPSFRSPTSNGQAVVGTRLTPAAQMYSSSNPSDSDIRSARWSSLSDNDLRWLTLQVKNADGPLRQKPLLTLRDFLADRSLTVKRTAQQPPSLIFRLPPELLAEICLHSTADDQDVSSPMRPHLVVSNVCALWRSVALHTPVLWCRVVLHLRARTRGFGGITNLAKACFERSCELPLALIITSSVSDDSRLPNLAIDLVLPVRHRIRHLELSLPAVFTESLFKLPRGSLMALRSIDISVLTDGHGTWFRSMSALEGAPLLTSVKFGAVYSSAPTFHLHVDGVPQVGGKLRFDPHVAGLPWGQLTELCFADVEIRCDDALHLLGVANALVRVKLDVDILKPLMPIIAFTTSIVPATSPEVPRRQPPVSAPALRELDLIIGGWAGGSSPVDLFDRLILPSLTQLSINYKLSQNLPCSTLLDLQTRSAFSLQQFSLTSRTGDSLIPFLQSNPFLWRLQLVFSARALAPLAAALMRDAEIQLLPRLVALTLIDRWAEEARTAAWVRAAKAVVDMARTRWRVDRAAGSTRLESFTFGSGARISATKAARLGRMRQEGMRGSDVYLIERGRQLSAPDYMNTWADGY
ncbi:fungal-specific transcription factor domain-containing protein [Mycena epipterygia]|nr:fungal-specific transcription factor domain-containing protein [Mycena epipterygia]